MRNLARTPCRFLVIGLVFVLPAGFLFAGVPQQQAERVAYVAGNLSDESLITLASGLAAAGSPEVLLLDTPRSCPQNRLFLKAYRPDRVILVGAFPDGTADLEHRLDMKAGPAVGGTVGPPVDLWKMLFPRVERVVVCPAEPRPL